MPDIKQTLQSAALDDVALTEEALAELDSGLGIPLADIKAWVGSWGTDEELPPPEARRFRPGPQNLP